MTVKTTIYDAFITLVVIALALVIAYLIPDSVSIVWQVAGSLVCIAIAVFLPALAYLLLLHGLRAKIDKYSVVCGLAVVLSVPLIIVCTYHNVVQLF